MKTLEATPERIYSDPITLFAAFSDILEVTGNGIFKNICFFPDEGYLTYEAYGKPIKKVFNMQQGTPELASDLMDWLFSMLDAVANM